jgi:hypothetical protein
LHNTLAMRFIAPMKLNLNKSTVVRNGWRCGAVLLASVCLVWVAFISSSAQLRTLKHVTSLQLGQAAEGARVTVISDSALNDYEAFRRGDRFYVKIPQAEFAFSQPSFHGDGFDDVQVQKVGDSVVVSFKLQPGASARVDEHSNRLDVIFTAPNRSQRGGMANVAGNRTPSAGVNRSSANQSNPNRQPDTAGPAPSDWNQVSRERFATGRRNTVSETPRQAAPNARTESVQSRTSVANNRPGASSSPISVASPAAVPHYSPTSSYNPATTSPPISSTGSKPAGVSANSPNWDKARDWFSANSNASLLGAFLLTGLLVLLTIFLSRRRTAKPSATRAKSPLARPKYDSRVELDELTDSRPEPLPVGAAPIIKPSQEFDWSAVGSQPAFARTAEVSASNASVSSRPSISSAIVADSKSVSEEREVFEL